MTALITFLRTTSSAVEHEHGALLGAAVVDIFDRRLLEVHDPPADLGDPVLGLDQDRRRRAKRSLKRRAISRISSTCWRWSSPTGTSPAL